MSLKPEDLKAMIRVVPGFPRLGISFKDITTLLADGEAWRYTIRELAGRCRGLEAKFIVGPEARGFIVGAALAYELGAGFVPVRKAGKLPALCLRGDYQLEYGKDSLEIHRDAIRPGDRVLVVDDLLATGGTVEACVKMVEQLGGQVVGLAFLIELTELRGRERFAGYHVVSLIDYPF
jgi:adenine phosphoribosyltransferase